MFSALRCISCRQIFRVDGPLPNQGRRRPSRRCAACALADAEAVGTPSIGATDALVGSTQNLIYGLKYRNQRAAVALLAEQILHSIENDPEQPSFDLVTWAPTSANHRRRRGYDQSELLARAVAKSLGLRCRRLLYRDRSAPQTGRTRQQRLVGPVFRARPLKKPSRVLVIDDVVTTGSTLKAAAHALNMAGISDVTLFAVAATPKHRPITAAPIAVLD